MLRIIFLNHPAHSRFRPTVREGDGRMVAFLIHPDSGQKIRQNHLQRGIRQTLQER